MTKRSKIPLAPGDEVEVPLSGGRETRLILSVLACEFDQRTGGAIKFLVDPNDIKIHGDGILKDFSADGVKYTFNRLTWDEDQCVLIYNIRNK